MRAHRRQDLTEDLTKTDQTTWPEQSGAILARMTQASGISQSMRRGDESRSASANEDEEMVGALRADDTSSRAVPQTAASGNWIDLADRVLEMVCR